MSQGTGEAVDVRAVVVVAWGRAEVRVVRRVQARRASVVCSNGMLERVNDILRRSDEK